MAKLKAIYWDDRTLFSKEKLDEYIIILADLIKKWDPVKFDGTSFKLMSYFEEMQKVLSMLKDEFEEERNLEEIVDLKNISSYHPLTKELEEQSVLATDRWGVAFIMTDDSMKTMNIKDMIFS
ncbi:hypothetical protein L1994_10095 [Methanomicrobium antiquum]|uniref:Uncharacterized protein n=1 Tax=Methanomicrobium antiquum TaxID=487686 RepID=A0AAF0FQ50_9EURY|nr:hypothetical protein [Methanomicrobium antiquum]MDD3977192.1 hypothetical protein [Methanomicrobium sp.]WFN36482.1 hypothetical protein L1994_10095 [Methanomicrobium antiquum]